MRMREVQTDQSDSSYLNSKRSSVREQISCSQPLTVTVTVAYRSVLPASGKMPSNATKENAGRMRSFKNNGKDREVRAKALRQPTLPEAVAVPAPGHQTFGLL